MNSQKIQTVDQEFNDLADSEFYEMIELIEKMRHGEITAEEMQKLKYISKTRENLFGGDV